MTLSYNVFSQAAGTPYMPNLKNAYTFSYTGANQTWTVPSGITSIVVDVYGGGSNGAGARVQATVPVTPGQTLSLIHISEPTRRS